MYIPSDAPYGNYTLNIHSKDLAETDNLKVNQGITEIDTALITRDGVGAMRGEPGPDQAHQILVGDDNVPPTITWYDMGVKGDGSN